MRAIDGLPAEVREVPGGAVTVLALASVFVAFPLTFMLGLIAGLVVALGLPVVGDVLLFGAAVSGMVTAVAIAVSIIGNVGLVIWSAHTPRERRRSVSEINAWRWAAAWELDRRALGRGRTAL